MKRATSISQKPVAETERGTPVYTLDYEIPPEIVPKEFEKKRGLGEPDPYGPFAAWLNTLYPRSTAVIVRYRRYTKIFKIGKGGDVFPLTARSVKKEDRARLVKDGLLNKT